MKNRYAKSKIDYIELLFTYFQELDLGAELKSHIARYLTVLISGIYEDIIKNFIKDYIQKETIQKEVRSFVFRQIDITFRNPSYKNIKTLLNKFNKDWIKVLNGKIDEKNRDALNSIINNKNNIAHGDSPAITFDIIKEYYQDSKCIIEELDKIILKE